MHSELKVQHVSTERLLADYVNRRLDFALSRFGERIGRVTTRITATAGSRPELRCRITSDFHPFGPIHAEATDADVYTAIDRCTGRLARRCASKCSRARSGTSARMSIRVPKQIITTQGDKTQ
jgi:ribosomal subunit interface protein